MGSRTIEFYDDGRTWRNTLSNDSVIHSASPDKITFSHVSPQDTVAYATSTDKIHYTRGQVLGSIQRRSAFKKGSVAPPPPPPPPLTYSAAVLADSPRVYWRLDETSGTTAADSSGNGNAGTYIGGPTLNQDPLILDGWSVRFDGSNDQIDGPALNLLGNVTVEAWYRPAALPSNAYVLSHGGAAGSEAEVDNASYSIFVNGSSLSMLWEYGGGTNVVVSSGTTLVVGTLYHIVMERDATAKTVTFTVNGVANVVGYSTNPTGGGSGILSVGYFANAGRANGVIDEVAVYDHLLGSSRVSTHYNLGTGV